MIMAPSWGVCNQLFKIESFIKLFKYKFIDFRLPQFVIKARVLV